MLICAWCSCALTTTKRVNSSHSIIPSPLMSTFCIAKQQYQCMLTRGVAPTIRETDTPGARVGSGTVTGITCCALSHSEKRCTFGLIPPLAVVSSATAQLIDQVAGQTSTSQLMSRVEQSAIIHRGKSKQSPIESSNLEI